MNLSVDMTSYLNGTAVLYREMDKILQENLETTLITSNPFNRIDLH